MLKTVDGAAYLKDYNFKLLPGHGAYKVEEADIQKGKSVSIRRRADYWAEKYRRNVGLNNFDEIREIVVRDQKLAFEMFKKGDIDDYYVNVSREWVEEMNFDKVAARPDPEAEDLQRRAERLRRASRSTRASDPFDDIRVRKALDAAAESGRADQEAVLQRIRAAQLVLCGRHLREPEQPEERSTTRRRRCSCSRKPAGRIATRRGGS